MSVNSTTERSNPAFHRSFLVGGFAHTSEVLVLGHLLDRIRVEQEIHPSLRAMDALCSIWKRGRWEMLFRGIKWNVTSSALKGSIGWTLHNFSNRTAALLYPQTDLKRPSLAFTVFVGLGAAFLETSLILCPLERLKTVEMTTTSKQQYKIKSLLKEEGISFFYRGWHIVMLRQSCSWISYLGVYQKLRQLFLKYNDEQPLSLKQKIFLGSATGGLVATITTPLDMLKTHAQKAGVAKTESSFVALRSVFMTNGLKGIYNGLSMKVLRQTWSSAIVFIVLDRLGALPINMRV